MSWHRVDQSKARRFAVARPKLSGRRSSSTVLNQIRLSLPVLCRQSLGGLWMQAWRARECHSWLVSSWQRCPKKARRRRRVVSDRSGWFSSRHTSWVNFGSLWKQSGKILERSGVARHWHCYWSVTSADARVNAKFWAQLVSCNKTTSSDSFLLLNNKILRRLASKCAVLCGFGFIN